MKKKNYTILSIIFLIIVSACAGYEPIFKTQNIQFKISEHSIEGEKLIGNKIFSKLNKLSNYQKDKTNLKSISIKIISSKNKEEATKDSAGNVLEYKITLSTKIEITDYVNQNKLLNQNFVSSIIYKVQNQYSQTLKLENKSIEDLIEKTYQELIIRISESI
tara:strand:+ start:532 stop:1017 length:486 start_codon:yes stop_codon:yes gene_type:complete